MTPPAQAQPERPALALNAAEVGESDAIAIFLDLTSRKTVRLRQGDTRAGWAFSSVLGCVVTFRKAASSDVLILQRHEETAGGIPATPAARGEVIPAADGGMSYAPFTPRSTPKNGGRSLSRNYFFRIASSTSQIRCCCVSLKPSHIGSLISRSESDVVSERSPCARPNRIPAGEECSGT